MSPAEIERRCISIVPGTGELSVQRLGIGLISETYKVARDGIAYVLKTAAEHRAGLGSSLVWEAQLLERAAGARLAPPLVCCDPQGSLLLSEWVAGHPWAARDVRLPKKISRIAALLRRVHALPIPASPRVMSPLSWIELYAASLKRSTRHAIDADLRNAAEERLQLLARLPPCAGVVCHSDLHRMNLLEDGEMLILLDWEYAHVSDPFWDLAGWSANNDLDVASLLALLGNYLGSAPAAADVLRLRVLIWLYDYVCLLWSELYLKALSATPDGGYDDIARRATFLDARLRLPAHYAA